MSDETATGGRVRVYDDHMPIRVDKSGAVLFASRDALVDALALMRDGDVALVGYVDVELNEIRCLTATDLVAIRENARLRERVATLEAALREAERKQAHPIAGIDEAARCMSCLLVSPRGVPVHMDWCPYAALAGEGQA